MSKTEAPLRPDLEEKAQAIAALLAKEPALMLGWLEGSIEAHLNRPRWTSRERLLIDLRVARIVMSRSRTAEDQRRSAALAKFDLLRQSV